MTELYTVDAATVPWIRGETEGLTFACQVLLSGEDGGPEAMRFRFDPSPSVYAHMHLTSQFQVLVGGEMEMPRGSMNLRPLAVHYTDHSVPYGPFSVRDGHDMLVLHPKRGGLVPMTNLVARKLINVHGRLIVSDDEATEWVAIPGVEGARAKVLIPEDAGPEVVLLEVQPGCTLGAGALAPVYGRYDLVLDGLIVVDGRPIGALGLRYVKSDEPATPFVAGPDGARLVILSFDADALEGGLTGPLAATAADALAGMI